MDAGYCCASGSCLAARETRDGSWDRYRIFLDSRVQHHTKHAQKGGLVLLAVLCPNSQTHLRVVDGLTPLGKTR